MTKVTIDGVEVEGMAGSTIKLTIECELDVSDILYSGIGTILEEIRGSGDARIIKAEFI